MEIARGNGRFVCQDKKGVYSIATVRASKGKRPDRIVATNAKFLGSPFCPWPNFGIALE